MVMLARRGLLDAIPTPVPLTLSGNEDTPATRAAGTQGDGLTGPYAGSSIGVWEATTNLVTNGGFETNTTGWSGTLSGTIARITTAYHFGIACLEVTTAATTVGSGGRTSGVMALTSGQTYAFSFWVRCPSGTHNLSMVVRNAATTAVLTTSAVAVGQDWVRLTGIYAAVASETHYFGVAAADSEASFVIHLDDAQCENQPCPTPYVHTDGGTASRSASRDQLTGISRYITATQGYAAFLLRPGWTNTQDPSANPVIFDWRDDGNNLLQLRFDTTNDQWEFQRRNGGGTAEVVVADTFTGSTTLVFLLASWTATDLYLSLDGVVPVTAVGGNIPTLAATALDVGSIAGTSEHADSLFLFKAFSKTAITTVGPAAALNNIARNNRIDSRIEDIPGGCTFKWPSENWREGMAL